jgi:hypothetical protein
MKEIAFIKLDLPDEFAPKIAIDLSNRVLEVFITF